MSSLAIRAACFFYGALARQNIYFLLTHLTASASRWYASTATGAAILFKRAVDASIEAATYVGSGLLDAMATAFNHYKIWWDRSMEWTLFRVRRVVVAILAAAAFAKDLGNWIRAVRAPTRADIEPIRAAANSAGRQALAMCLCRQLRTWR